MRFLTSAFVLLSLIVLSGAAQAQSAVPPAPQPLPAQSLPVRTLPMRPDSLHHMPGRGVISHPALQKSYADSTEFNAAFGSTYEILKPKESMLQRAHLQFSVIYPRYKNKGVDSASAWKSIVKSLDTAHDRQVLFQAYRTTFNAKELKEYNAFLKTATGKKMYEAQARLASTSIELQGYISRMVMSTIMPMAKGADQEPPMHAPMPPPVMNPPPGEH
jgi:hypothetical protein